MFSTEEERSCESYLPAQRLTRQQGHAQGFYLKLCVLGIASTAQEGACCHHPLCDLYF